MAKKKNKDVSADVVSALEDIRMAEAMPAKEEEQSVAVTDYELWVLKVKQQDGRSIFTRPCTLKEIEQFCKQNNLGGTLYFCQLVESHEIKVAIDFGWDRSPLLK